ASAAVREAVRRLGLVDDVTDTPGAAVTDADLVILCVPVGVMGAVAAEIAADLPADAIVSDVGSSKEFVARALTEALPDAIIVPA
ncbi:cyclohexadienyl dehydrogenase, partial [Pseudomonas sp. FW305-130]